MGFACRDTFSYPQLVVKEPDPAAVPPGMPAAERTARAPGSLVIHWPEHGDANPPGRCCLVAAGAHELSTVVHEPGSVRLRVEAGRPTGEDVVGDAAEVAAV
jgi:hypothetical protein